MAKGRKATSTASGETTNVSVGQVAAVITGLVQAAPIIMYLISVFPALAADHVTLFVVGIGLLCVTGYVFYHVLYKTLKLRSALGFLFTAITFTAYIDTCIALSLATPNFTLGKFYTDKGERYFKSAYGFMCLFWDGTFHVVIQFALAVFALTNQGYHFTALVWAGSIINSMAPLLLGAATGPYSDEIQLATALNAPYVFFPFGILIYLLSMTPITHRREGSGSRVRSHHLLTDVALMLYNFLVPIVHILRVMCVMDSEAPIVAYWKKVEPVFDKKAMADKNDLQDYAFMAIQANQWAFWFILWHWASLYEQIERIRTGKRTILLGDRGVDFAALMLGGYLQSLACHIGASYLDMNEDQVGLFVRSPKLPIEFWLINISTLVCAVLHFVHLHVQDIEDVSAASVSNNGKHD